MSESENERVVKKIFEAYNRHDWDAMMDHFSDDATAVWPNGSRGDKEGIRKQNDALAIFPDSRVQVDRMVSQGNTVVVEWTFTGTHRGEWLGIPATNKKVENLGVWILDFEAGKVKLKKVYFNVRRLEQFLRE